MDRCIICESSNCESIAIEGFQDRIKCKSGFDFIIDNHIFDLSKIELIRYRNLIIEWLLRYPDKVNLHQFVFNDSSDSLVIEENIINLSTLIKNYPNNINDRVNRSLINLSNYYPMIGNQIGLSIIDDSLVFVDNEDNYTEYIGFLSILEEFGYLNNSVSNAKIYSITAKGWLIIEEIRKKTKSSKKAFIAMSFKKENDGIRESFKKAIIAAGYTPVLIDEKEHNNQIVPEILYEIDNSSFVVVDVSDPNFGAYFEAGYAIGLGKQVIICCRKDILDSSDAKLRPHFDISQKSQVIWIDYDDLVIRLSKRIQATIL